MNITKSIEKVKGLLDQLKDSTDKFDAKYPENSPMVKKQEDDTLKAILIIEGIETELEGLYDFLHESVEPKEQVPVIPETPEVPEGEGEIVSPIIPEAPITKQPETPEQQ